MSAGITHQRSRSSEQPNLSTKNQDPLRIHNQLSTSILVEKLTNNKPVDGPITNKAYIPLNDSIYRNVETSEKIVLTSQNVPPLPLKRISGNNFFEGNSKNDLINNRPVLPPRQFNVIFTLYLKLNKKSLV